MMHYKTRGTCSTAIDLEIEGEPKKSWCYQNGMADYLNEMMVGTPVAPIFVGEKYVETANGFAIGETAYREVLLQHSMIEGPDSHAPLRDWSG